MTTTFNHSEGFTLAIPTMQETQQPDELPGDVSSLMSAISEHKGPMAIALAAISLGLYLWKKFGPKKEVKVEAAGPKTDTSAVEKLLGGKNEK